MAPIRTIAVCYPQVPFFFGGAELLVRGLCQQLEARGYRVCPVSVPFRWTPKDALMDQCLAWRLLDLTESNGVAIDRVIATKFPSYTVSHPNKVTWLVHQYRQAYDLFGTELSEFTRSPDDQGLREMLRRVDCRALSESRYLYAMSATVADRLREYNGLEAEPIHHPPPRAEAFGPGPAGDYVLSVGRLDRAKRVEELVRAVPHTSAPLRFVVAGDGPELGPLRALAAHLRVEDRIDFLGGVGFDELVELYRNALAVYFAPILEDYGYVTLEAFLSHKPVVTAPDAGGPLEFVEDGETGVVVELEPEKLGEQLRRLDRERAWAAELGRAGYERVRDLRWDPLLDALTRP